MIARGTVQSTEIVPCLIFRSRRPLLVEHPKVTRKMRWEQNLLQRTKPKFLLPMISNAVNTQATLGHCHSKQVKVALSRQTYLGLNHSLSLDGFDEHETTLIPFDI